MSIDVDVLSGEVLTEALTSEQARELTEQIAVGLAGTWQLVKAAYNGRAWLALGYATWDDYCGQEFGGSRITLPREERAETVQSLRDAGLSIRAIASATGTSKDTVHRALREGVSNETPGGPSEPDVAPPITGTDGKTYRSANPQPKTSNPMQERVEDLRENDPEIHAAHVAGKFSEALVAFLNIARKLDPEDVSGSIATGRDGDRIERLTTEVENWLNAYRDAPHLRRVK